MDNQKQYEVVLPAYMTRSAETDISLETRDLSREMDGEVGAIDVAARTVEIAFSSEAEYRRYFGIEILDHSPGSVRLERLHNGAPTLFNHNRDDYIAVVESARIDGDKKGRAVVRFSTKARAEEIFQDIINKIIRHVSVGYRINRAIREGERDGVDIIRVVDWTPYEISFVTIPADDTVGVGRGAEVCEIPQVAAKAAVPENEPSNQPAFNLRGEQDMKIKFLRNAAGDLVRAEVDEDGNIVNVLEVVERAGETQRIAQNAGAAALAKEQQRAQDILNMGEQFNCADLAREYVRSGASAEDFSKAALVKLQERISRPLDEQSRDADIGMSDQDAQRYSIMRVVRALAHPQDQAMQRAAAFEFECSEAAQARYGRSARSNGIIIPSDVLRAFNAGAAANTPTGAITGANLVGTEHRADAWISMLRNKVALLRMATVIGGLVGNIEIPKQTAGATSYWIGEGEDATEATPTIGQIKLAMKTIAAYTDITRNLAMQSTPDAEIIVRNDLANSQAQGIDLAGYYGTGTDNQPKGMALYDGINVVNFATAGQPTFKELVTMETEVSADNADLGQMGYIGNSRFRGHCKTTPKFGNGTEATVWEPGNTVNGYRTEITNQVKNGDVFFGNFGDVLIGMWGGLDLMVDPYSLSKSGGIRIVTFQSLDIALRRVESICFGTTETP